MVMALFAIWIIFQHQTDGAFLEPRNLSNLLRQMSVTGILAGGMVLVIVTGQIDLSVGSVVAFLGGILAVLMAQKGMAPGPALGITLVMGAFIGCVQGYLLSYQRIPAFIVTLGGMMAFRGASMWITQNSTIPLPDNWIMNIGTSYIPIVPACMVVGVVFAIVLFLQVKAHLAQKAKGLVTNSSGFIAKWALLFGVGTAVLSIFAKYEGFPLPVFLMLALLLIIHVLATQTVWGRHVYAIGGNPEAAFLSGIRVKARMLSVFILMGILSAIGGVVLATRVGSASPDAGQLLELDAIASCVIGGTSLMGGKGSIFGAILGALVMESLNNGMSLANMEPFWQYILKGLVLVLAVWVDVLSQGKKTF